MTSTRPWRDQVALVTGGARGIGRATARRLAQHGAAVCVNYAAHADAAGHLVAEITGEGGRAIAAVADVGDAAAVDAMVARTEKELGPLTILINNAGVSWRGTLDEYDAEAVARMRRINVEGVIHATRAVAGGMRQRQFGRIVNVSSIAALGTGLPGNAFYAATKAEVAILTKRFAMELGPHGITVSGGVRSPKPEPWWNADRRAASEASAGGDIGRRGAEEINQTAFVGVPLPIFF
jgi:NAD(P)-dependent dehydrogenase (short-subunit alcohol dehydrogenase family)